MKLFVLVVLDVNICFLGLFSGTDDDVRVSISPVILRFMLFSVLKGSSLHEMLNLCVQAVDYGVHKLWESKNVGVCFWF